MRYLRSWKVDDQPGLIYVGHTDLGKARALGLLELGIVTLIHFRITKFSAVYLSQHLFVSPGQAPSHLLT